MSRSRRFATIVGGALLLVGLASAFLSSRLEGYLMGETRLGYARLAPQPGSPEDQANRRARGLADLAFYFGIVSTAAGVIVQTAAAVWPDAD